LPAFEVFPGDALKSDHELGWTRRGTGYGCPHLLRTFWVDPARDWIWVSALFFFWIWVSALSTFLDMGVRTFVCCTFVLSFFTLFSPHFSLSALLAALLLALLALLVRTIGF